MLSFAHSLTLSPSLSLSLPYPSPLLAASMARKIYLRGGAGIGALSKIYGGSCKKHACGPTPPHFARAARGLLRHILKQLQDLDLVGSRKEQK